MRNPRVESGFDALPLERRAKAFASNSEGWEAQTRLIAKHLAQVAGAAPARG